MPAISSLVAFISSLIPFYSSSASSSSSYDSASASSSSSYDSASASSSSPSSSSTPSWNYDVFLSFRGEDTRYRFTDHLYSSLCGKGIRTFRDDKLKRGEEIAPELLKGIEESRFSIIVFSENYAHSRWCLDELVKIMECRKDVGQSVFPIFYHVDPSHVRKQTGSFGKAFANYEKNWKHKVRGWRKALTEAADLSGWHLIDGYESEDIKKISDNIFRRLHCKRLDVDDNLVGIDSRVKEVILRLHMESNDVYVVGICGIGGIGKTTIAKVVCNELFGEFECMSFLENIREVSTNAQYLLRLQNQFLGDILEGEGSQNISSANHGASMIRTTLRSKKVLIVLDNVDDVDQLKYLLRNLDWLGKGSRVIITTRNRHLLTVQGVENLYEVEELNYKEAYKLFSLNAFKQNLPKLDFESLSTCIVRYCQGLPLALKVVGSLLFQKTIPQWESELRKLKRVPAQKIQEVLKISFEGLDHSERNIFLDIACFFKEEDKDFVSRILDGCNFYAERGIKNLMDMCLITIPYNHIHMHDLIQQMGWEVVRGEFPYEPEKWSRLWDPQDIECALTTYEGIKGVETISLDVSKLKGVYFISNVLAKMTRLRLLRIHSSINLNLKYMGLNLNLQYMGLHDEDIRNNYNAVMKDVSRIQLGQDFEFSSYQLRYLYWDGYPLNFFPSNFDGRNLIELHLKCSNIKQLWQGNKYLEMLKVIDLSFSMELIQMPEFSSMSNLEKLVLIGCVSLIEIHPSIGVLKKLKTLYLNKCHKLKGFPSSIALESLEILDLSLCSSFDKFPEIQGNMGRLQELYLHGTAIKELPNSIGNLESLWCLDLSYCSKFENFPDNGGNMKSLKELYLNNTSIKDLPNSIGNLESLQMVNLSYCTKFEKIPEMGGNMKSLKVLSLSNTAIKELPNSIYNLESLEILYLSRSPYFPIENSPWTKGLFRRSPLRIGRQILTKIPDLCSKFDELPENIGNMKRLKELYLNHSAIKELPTSIQNLDSLLILDLRGCSNLDKFPEIQRNMKSLKWLCLSGTAIKELPNSTGNLESLEFLDLSSCSKFQKFPDNGSNMKSLKTLYLSATAIEELPNSICNLESLEVLSLSYCRKFQKFPDNGRNMKSLKKLDLFKTLIEELPNSICNLESLESLSLSNCSKFQKFPDNGRNMKSLKELYLNRTAIKELPNSICNLESLRTLDLSACSKFQKFPDNGRNMKSLKVLYLRKTAIKELPNNICNLESLRTLDLSNCSKFQKFPDNGRKMKSLKELYLCGTAIKELPNSIYNLESLEDLDLSNCSKFQKFPEMERSMKHLLKLNLSQTAIKSLPSSMYYLSGLHLLDLSGCNLVEGSIPSDIWCLSSLQSLNLSGNNIISIPAGINQLRNLKRLDISHCKMLREISKLPSSLEEIDAHDCTSKEDWSRQLWSCHLNWLKATTQELKCWKFYTVIPGSSSGIPEWTMYPGSEIKIELPMNWYEDGDFLGFALSCLYRPVKKYKTCPPEILLECEFSFNDDEFGFSNKCWCVCRCCCYHFNGVEDQLCVWWYPKIAIPTKHGQNKLRHFNASFREDEPINMRYKADVKKCGVNLIFAGDHQHNHMGMFLDHLQNSDDNGSAALQDTNGDVVLGVQDDDNGSIAQDGNGNLKRSRDDSLPKPVEEPQHKRLRAPNTDLIL